MVSILIVQYAEQPTKVCDKAPLNNCNCHCNLHVAIKALETTVEELIRAVNKSLLSTSSLDQGTVFFG